MVSPLARRRHLVVVHHLLITTGTQCISTRTFIEPFEASGVWDGEALERKTVAKGAPCFIPRCYMVPGLVGWTRETVAEYARGRNSWIVDK